MSKVIYKEKIINAPLAADFSELNNDPLINSVDLVGDKNTQEIKVSWFGTQAEFNSLGTINPETLYVIEDGDPNGEQKDYNNLIDIPTINGVSIVGNKLSVDLNMYDKDEIDNILASIRSIKVVAALPGTPTANTIYYVGPDSEMVYEVYLYDSMANQVYLGPSVQKLYEAGRAVHIDFTTNVLDIKYDNSTIDLNSAGELEIIKSAILDMMFPVGSIHISTTLSSPSAIHDALGGTWTSVGATWITLVGVDPSDNEFKNAGTYVGPGANNARDLTFAAATGNTGDCTLTQAQMPKHNHVIYGFSNRANDGNAVLADTSGGYNAYSSGAIRFNAVSVGGGWKSSSFKTAGNNGLGDWCGSTQSMGGGGGSHNHTLNSHTHTKAISIAQPWIACYIWRRSA